MKNSILIRYIILSLYFISYSGYTDIYSLSKNFFNNVGDNRSIPDGVVTAIVKDNSGFLWIGTQKGLVKYDGYTYEKYVHETNNKNSITGNYINSLFVSKDGQIYIGTLRSGLSIYNPKNDTFINFKSNEFDTDSIASNRIDAIVEDSSGSIWLATYNGVDMLPINSRKFKHFQNIENDPTTINDNRIITLVIDNNGYLWVGSWNGLNKINTTNYKVESVYSIPNEVNSFYKQHVTSLIIDDQKTLWVGTQKTGYAKITTDSNITRFNLTNNDLNQPWIWSIIQVSENNIWLGTTGVGIYVIDKLTGNITKHLKNSISGNTNFDQIGALFVDKDNLIWVGTWGKGLHYYHPNNSFLSVLPQYDLDKSNNITYLNILSMMFHSDGTLWLGTQNNGIEIRNEQWEIVTSNKKGMGVGSPLESASIRSIHQSNEKDVWIGTLHNGLYKYDNKNEILVKIDEKFGISSVDIIIIISTDDGRIWVGTNDGLFVSKPGHLEFERVTTMEKPLHHFNDPVWLMAKQENDGVWVATTTSLYRVLPGENKLRKIEISDDNTIIQKLFVDSNDLLWVSTSKGVFQQVNKNDANKFELIDTKLNLADPLKFGDMHEDFMGRIWSQNFVLDPANWTIKSFDDYNSPNIGTLLAASTAKNKKGYILFGGTEGVRIINPENYKKTVNIITAPTITKIIIDDRITLVKPSKTLHLKPFTKNFSIEFVAANLTSSNIRYSYRLEGFDKDWIPSDSKHRVARYTNLSPGNYTLHIQSTTENGEEKSISIEIILAPGFYQTWWFKLLTLISIFILLFLFYRYRIRKIDLRRKQLETLVDVRTVALESKTKEAIESYELLLDTQNQLVEIRKQAVLGGLVAGIAHELNTPIGTAITAHGQLEYDIEELKSEHTQGKLTKKGFNSKLERLSLCAGIISKSLLRTASLITTFKKISNSNKEIENTTFRLDLFLFEVIPTLESTITNSGHKLVVDIQNDINITSKKEAFHSILKELIDNSINHAFNGDIKNGVITIRLKAIDSNVTLSISDNGQSIECENQSKIFDPFFTTNRGEGGVGLGLHILYNIVTQQLKGKIECSSSDNVGTEFIILFPEKKL